MTKSQRPNIWEGIYDSFADAPARGSGFSGETWNARLGDQLSSEKKALEIGGVAPESVRFQQYLLAPVAATQLANSTALTVIDFGGGMGSGYVALRATLPRNNKLDYHVVELPEVCDKAKTIFGPGEGPVFHSDFPTTPDRFDLAHAGSSLQYIDDWRSILARLSAYRPPFMLLSDMLAGEIKPFVTLQHYYGDLIPMRFLNIDDVKSVMDGLGYALVFQAPFVRRILGNEGNLPMDNFPPEYRINNASHLLFKAFS